MREQFQQFDDYFEQFIPVVAVTTSASLVTECGTNTVVVLETCSKPVVTSICSVVWLPDKEI